MVHFPDGSLAKSFLKQHTSSGACLPNLLVVLIPSTAVFDKNEEKSDRQ